VSVAELSVALGDYPHTRAVKDGTLTVGGRTCVFADVDPIHRAFGPMVRELRYDVCELGVATLLQAREAGVPITVLPLAMNGDGHHRSLSRRPDREPFGPGELAGRPVAVRAYSQTTGMWVRGLLREEHGIEADQITWVTTEGPHVDGYAEPAWTTRADGTVASLVAEGAVAAAAIGPRALAAQGLTLKPVFADPDAADEAWIARHHTIPVNHLVVVRTELVRTEPVAIDALYRALRDGIEATADERDDTAHGRAVRAGWTDELRTAIEIAGRFGVEQGLLREPVDVGVLQAETGPLEL
jgi:4,5-dihydroxyphthalate decarboxylase